MEAWRKSFSSTLHRAFIASLAVPLPILDPTRPRGYHVQIIPSKRPVSHNLISHYLVFLTRAAALKTGENPGAPEASRPHHLPIFQGFFGTMKDFYSLVPPALTSFNPLLPDKKLLPFGRGGPSVEDACVSPSPVRPASRSSPNAHSHPPAILPAALSTPPSALSTSSSAPSTPASTHNFPNP